MRLAILLNVLMLPIVCCSGCSSLGLSFWPSQFPLLRATKDLAAQSPMPSGLPSELEKEALANYFVEPGDRVLIEPAALDSEFRLVGDQKIQVDGSLDLGQFGRLQVAGMPVESIETAIENRIQQVSGKPESINVQLIETNAAEVYVLGEVGSPGAYALDGHETILDAILTAGGLTSQASPCDIVFVRPTPHCEKRVVLPICYRQITQLGDTTSNYQLQPGDRIVVGARTLCEELAVWRQTSSCPRCKCDQQVECQPGSRQYTNRFASWFSQFPMPRDYSETDAASASLSDEKSAPPAGLDSGTTQTESPTAPVLEDDSDLFLPKIPAPSPSDARLPDALNPSLSLEPAQEIRLAPENSAR